MSSLSIVGGDAMGGIYHNIVSQSLPPALMLVFLLAHCGGVTQLVGGGSEFFCDFYFLCSFINCFICSYRFL